MISDWAAFFKEIKGKQYAISLNAFLDKEYAERTIYPPRNLLFHAFDLTSPTTTKVVIIGQDPYHNPGQAMGLCFSVPTGVELPPSLINIYKEIESDVGAKMDFSSGDLSKWAKQGVLLLNAYLSVRRNEPLSHAIPEYKEFLIDTMKYLDTLDGPIVFLLWGSFAKRFAPYVTNKKHLVIMANHPSPLSANRGGWFNQKVFSRCNDFLVASGSSPIDWSNK